jgi:DNA-binding response OmpR family regulator
MVQSLNKSGSAGAAEPQSSPLARFPASPLVSRLGESEAGPIRVLIVEDDENYREIVSSELEWHGFAVRSFADGDALLGSLDATAEADVIVLDWRPPTISGIDLLPELRQRGVTLPMVFLTSHAEPTYEKLAFERGALDFIDKTRGVEILATRLKARGLIRACGHSRGREAHHLRQAHSQSGHGQSLLERGRCRSHRQRIRHRPSSGVERR